jgi:hypothetical protein
MIHNVSELTHNGSKLRGKVTASLSYWSGHYESSTLLLDVADIRTVIVCKKLLL